MEYKIIEGQTSDVQKILNQWRNKYDFNIIAVNSFPDTFPDNDGRQRAWTVITLTREEF